MASKGKGRASENVSLSPMPNPSAGSANPSVSFPALWNYLEPALDHIVRSPSNDPKRAPTIEVAYHMGIHTAVYNYFTSAGRFDMNALGAPQLQHLKGSDTQGNPPHGADLYEKLDKYYKDVCQELLASAPVDDSELLDYLLPCFSRFSAGTQSVHRLLNYVNRHYVKRAVDDDHGWLRLTDMVDVVAHFLENGGSSDSPREHLQSRLRERRFKELKKWGYQEGDPPEFLQTAEAAAEAASKPDRIVPLGSMAYRRFREEVIKPLMAVPKVRKGKKKYKKHHGSSVSSTDTSSHGGGDSTGPKSRLGRAVRDLIEAEDNESLETRRETATKVNEMLKTVGIPNDLSLRKKLGKFSSQPKG
ncbi:hypothetical protein PNOK_0175200 [Pyrrhoderma noxium]|uniref:Cullin N-terminal domain-containing protein n=1 Tax=Pyrrhoderma noxium TaxID=2282107 RepID=A0A286UQP2_9AGAM|nr:hypothetical protein PNOK_0175200 [Pyrrhoderma noxium]